MLNEKNERELAYAVEIDGIEVITGSDNCEAAVIGGWRVMVKKNQFKPGDVAVYFEIDSKVDETNPVFAFLEKKKYAIKTQRYTFGGKGNFISQGLVMSFEDLGMTPVPAGTFLTSALNVTYYVAEDNSRKANSVDKYKRMAQRHPNVFKNKFVRWLMKREWGKKLLFVFFGKKRDKKTGWPSFVSKTDEERVQNMPWILTNKDPFIATEKLDGTSTTAALEMKKFGRHNFYICSRNVVFDKPDKKCFYETNVYTEMAKKYDFENVLLKIAKENHLKTIALQGETYGAGIQKRDYGMTDHDFKGFNLYFDGVRLNSLKAAAIVAEYGIPWVPIVDENFILPNTVDELLAYATDASKIDGGMREGIVFRSLDGSISFKAVSNEFLLKYHA